MVLVSDNNIPGIEIHQLLCGREIANGDEIMHFMAAEMANFIYLIVHIESKKV